MIPESRREAVSAALTATFTAPVAEMLPITGGVSGAQILRFTVNNRPYVLRIEPERIELHHRQRGYTCMTAAAAAGAAPPVHFADPLTGIAIMDLIPSRPLSEHPGGTAGLTRALGTLVAKVQAASPFPRLGDYPQHIADMLDDLAHSPFAAPGELTVHAEGLARIRTALPWHSASLVSSHNDPNVRNILFDGTRLWLVDWELASLNDPLVDVAILTTEFGESHEDALLEATFGIAPDKHVRARLHVIRLLTRLGYACIVLDSLKALPLPPLAISEPFTPVTFRAAVNEGRLAPGTPEIAYAFARMSLSTFLDGLTAPGFAEALEVVREG
jgi:aminoglycoside phosphotransferase (APT) family kinase protein